MPEGGGGGIRGYVGEGSWPPIYMLCLFKCHFKINQIQFIFIIVSKDIRVLISIIRIIYAYHISTEIKLIHLCVTNTCV